MDRIKNIQIPQACHQSWEQMTSVGEGRHCANCCKTVVDFTRMSNKEIIAYLSAHSHVCGRFDSYQINNLNYDIDIQNRKKLSWKGFIAGISFFAMFPVLKSEAMAKFNTTQTVLSFKKAQNEILPDTAHDIRIKGNVIGSDDHLPVQGAMIRIKGTNVGTQTDVNGNFTLRVKNADVIIVSYIGYTPQEIPVTSLKKIAYQFKLQLSAAMMGEVVITTPVIRRPKNVWYRLKGVLGTHSSLVPDEIPSTPYF